MQLDFVMLARHVLADGSGIRTDSCQSCHSLYALIRNTCTSFERKQIFCGGGKDLARITLEQQESEHFDSRFQMDSPLWLLYHLLCKKCDKTKS